MILKDPENLPLATEIFANTDIHITTTGERHLGAVIGSREFRSEYVTDKINKWIKDVEEIAEVANDEPQIAYSAYTKALCMRWCFLQRTVPDIKEYFIPLEEVIRDKLIPAIIGRAVTDLERKLISLPVRLGGMGIQDPTVTAQIEFRNSSIITRNLTELIMSQETTLDNYNAERMKQVISQLKNEKEERRIEQLQEVLDAVDEKLKRSIELAGEKGAGAWLTALPLRSLGYVLNKQQFRDAIRLRYGWKIPHTPLFCGCKKKNSVNHTLNCPLGGYVYMRHDNLKNYEASLLKEVCKDVRLEPGLLPIGNAEVDSRILDEKARLDVSAVGVWSPAERTFLDVRVVNLNSDSYLNQTPAQVYGDNERSKKRSYNDRILQVEKGSFSPLIFSTSGGMGPECTRFHKRVAELIAAKRGEQYSDVMNYIRTKLRFSLLKSILVAIRGVRGRGMREDAEVPISDLSLNIIPERSGYEL